MSSSSTRCAHATRRRSGGAFRLGTSGWLDIVRRRSDNESDVTKTAEQEAAAFSAALEEHRKSTRSREAKVAFLLRAGIIKPAKRSRQSESGQRYELVEQLGGPSDAIGDGR